MAGAAAGVVLVAGMLWPDGGVPGEAADGGGPVATQEPSGGSASETSANAVTKEADAAAEAEDASPEPEGPKGRESAVDEDPVVAASALLRTIADCRAHADVSCAGGVAAGATGIVDALEPAEAGSSTVELVDEYGDIAVVRVAVGASEDDDAAGAVALMVVLIRTQEKWLVRDVYDVADQPG